MPHSKPILIIYAHPDEWSFNAAILKTVIKGITDTGNQYQLIDLYSEKYNPVLTRAEMQGQCSAETIVHRQMIASAAAIIFIFPVWWFRAPAILEGFIDKTFTAGFAYRFRKIIGKYGLPVPLLKDKPVFTFITHGAPALPVKTLYLNVVKYRFLLGFLSFCFNLFKCRITQFWSVPFLTDLQRKKYLKKTNAVVRKRTAALFKQK